MQFPQETTGCNGCISRINNFCSLVNIMLNLRCSLIIVGAIVAPLLGSNFIANAQTSSDGSFQSRPGSTNTPNPPGINSPTTGPTNPSPTGPTNPGPGFPGPTNPSPGVINDVYPSSPKHPNNPSSVGSPAGEATPPGTAPSSPKPNPPSK